ncbi:dual specificity protein phosphatase [Thecamonas trahens ATCC 50062]|uniref:Dual specificity protein phosphatase n=1 Tax=Thecamonas trahens ATCC 50062 TaxID=461836 RepID=A0A0L0DUF3_THETB|nr:dual specificity protein phosphatase [Thecamonas trahens ATCC 50062]KNC55905.1 dual specificity protein phosphatase [Thecamonas trahens ATCC 50062]|eukprot:XP_013752724.1 dual specificity protein phosphatase [Thecamonas trahens ATCC 50062]
MTHASGLPLLAVLMLMAVAATPCAGVAPMSRITDRLWVGNQHAAGNLTLLTEIGITGVVNVAWDLDIMYPASEYVGSLAEDNAHLKLEYAKVGLVDGEGNANVTLAAAVFQVAQIMTKRTLETKDAHTYPNPPQRILLHCHSGMSRSVTIAALYLRYTDPVTYPDFAAALSYVKAARGISTDPAPALVALATAMSPHDIFAPFGGLPQ